MFISDARDVLIEAQDQLIDLLVQHDEATRAEDWVRVDTLKAEIANAAVRQNEIRNLIPSPASRPAG
jgi:hypothetical protein